MASESKPHSDHPGVHAETIPTRERIAKAHSRLPAEWHGWHAKMANGGSGHFAYHNSREACYICTLLDDLDSIEEQLETLRRHDEAATQDAVTFRKRMVQLEEAIRHELGVTHGDDTIRRLRAALDAPYPAKEPA